MPPEATGSPTDGDNPQSVPQDQPFDKDKLEAFLAGLNAQPSEPEDPFQLPQFRRIPGMLQEAAEWDKAGADASTPLAALLEHEDITSMIVSISMSPMHTEWEKARLIAAITLLAVREYSIELS